MGSVIAAYTVAWSVLMIYVLTLASRQRRIRRTLEQLATRLPAAESSSSGAGAHAR